MKTTTLPARGWRFGLALLTLAVLAAAHPAAAQPTEGEARLTALGGATLTVPTWKEVRKDAAVLVLEQLPDPATQKTYQVLMCAFEEGPTAKVVPWDKVRQNIVDAASKGGRALELAPKEPFTGAPGFEGQRFQGTFKSGAGKQVALEIVALVKDGKLLTVGVIAESLAPAVTELIDKVAKSARLGTP